MNLNHRGKALLSGAFPAKLALIMRMTAFFLLVFCLQLPARTLSQKINASFKEARLADVLDELSRQSGISIVYKEQIFRNARPVTVSIRDMSVEQAIRACMKGQPFTVEIDRDIIIVHDETEKPLNPSDASPPVDIKGQVLTIDRQPLPGASIRSKKDARVRTIADGSGRFSVHLTDNLDALIISYIGYQSQEIAIQGRDSITVFMKPAVAQLNEVVINGYGTQSKASFTGSASQVGSADLGNRDFASVDQNLQGRITGLQSVGSSGQPGALQSVRIRGTGSISASADPLYVVDGVVINTGQLSTLTTTSNALSALNPNDIETLTVLKDASASAIYGSRAANGVIIITTKQGAAGKGKINFDAEYGATYLGHIPDAGKPMTTAQWRQYMAQGLLNSPTAVAQNGLTPGNVLQYVDDNFGSGNGVNTDWYNVVKRTGHQQQYNLGFTGGNTNTQYHFSGGYFKQQGTVIGSDFNRYSANLDVRSKVNDRITIGSRLIIGNVHQVSPDAGGNGSNPINAAIHLYPFISPYNPDGTLNIDPVTFPSVQYNPLYQVANNVNTMDQLKGIGAVDGEVRILDNLKFTSRIGTDYTTIEEDYYRNPNYGDGVYLGGNSSRAYSRYFHWTWTNMLDYHVSLMQDEQLSANIKAGYQAEEEKDYYSSLQSIGFPANPALSVPSNGVTPYSALGYNEGYALTSQFSLAEISYKGRYILSGSYRRDGSSRFGAGNRYGNFWSVGGTWNAHEEAFIRRLDWISQLKARLSYGLIGNAGIGNYASQQTYGYGAQFNYNGMGGAFPNSVGNPLLTWETSRQTDLGFDAGFWKDRLTLVVDLYNRQADRLLLNQPTSQVTGFASFINNIGSMRNRGIEIAINGTPVMTKDFKWDIGFNLSHNTNKILALVDDQDIVQSTFIERVGMSFNTFYLRQWAGVDPATGSPLWYTNATRKQTTKNYNSASLVANYSSTPKLFGGITTSIAYKGFSLGGLLYYNFGNYVQDYWARITQSDGAIPTYNHFASQLGAWTKPGDQTDIPINIYNNTNNSARMSSRFLYKGDYMRLKELTLAYNFPKTMIGKTKAENLRIYLRGTNLFTWVKDKHLPYDPEQGLRGQSDYNIGMPRLFTGGVNLQF